MVVVVLAAKGRTTTRPGTVYATVAVVGQVARTTTSGGVAASTVTRLK